MNINKDWAIEQHGLDMLLVYESHEVLLQYWLKSPKHVVGDGLKAVAHTWHPPGMTHVALRMDLYMEYATVRLTLAGVLCAQARISQEIFQQIERLI